MMTSPTLDRVIIVSRIFTPEPGAAPIRLAALARALADAGAHVEVLTSVAPAATAAMADPDMHPLLRVRRATVLRDSEGYVRGYAQYLSFDVPLAFRLLFSARADVVLVEPPPTTGAVVRVICALRRIPYVYYAADIWSEAAATAGAPRLVTRILRGIERFAMTGAAQVLAVSSSVAERTIKIAPSSTVALVGNGFDSSLFTPNGPAHSEPFPYLLYAGTASEVHGAQVFIDALPKVLKAIPSARLVFIGQGSERAKMAERANEIAPGAVLFLPRLPAEQIAPWIRGAAATLASVLPNAYVAFPTKMLASAGCGTRVVYSGPEPGLSFARTPGVGWAADYSPEAVADAMIAALRAETSSDSRDELGQWAVAEHSLTSVTKRVIRAIESVLPSSI